MLESNLLILYGSQSGTAEDVAERVAREGIQFGFGSLVSAMNEYSVEQLVEVCNSPSMHVIFVAATTGQGDTPDNMKVFWRSLCRAHWDSSLLNQMKYGVIGLGDSSYEKYNFVGKKLFRRLKQLGGNPVLEICLGDDQHELGYHSAVNPWIQKLWSIVFDTEKGTLKLTNLLPKFVIHSVNKNSDSSNGLALDSGFDGMTMELRKVNENVRVTATNHWQDTRLISVDLKDSKLNFTPGDVLTVQPSNLDGNIDAFFKLFPELYDAPPFYLKCNPKMPWSKISPEIRTILGPQPWTWRKVVTHMLDIQSVPRLYFFELMSILANNELEKDRLSEFCTPQGQEDLFSYCNRPKRNILEVLEDFPHTSPKIPPVFLFDMIPVIKPRSFSIASSSRLFSDKVQILVAVVEYQTKIKNKRKGLCSNWLANYCPEGAMIPCWIQKGSFTFPPPDEDSAVLMIGPGTGVAPFRSIITERKESWNKWLFFGCRNEAADFYFKDEWLKLQEDNLLKFHCAFSRDSKGRKLQYVQDKILQESKELTKVFSLETNFYIYVAGNAKQMPKDVHAAIVQIMVQAGIKNPDNYLDLCSKKLGRYQTETWS